MSLLVVDYSILLPVNTNLSSLYLFAQLRFCTQGLLAIIVRPVHLYHMVLCQGEEGVDQDM